MKAAGGGALIKRGFSYIAKDNDAHAAKGMVCVDCHKTKEPQDTDRLRPEQLGQRRRPDCLRGLSRRTLRTRMPTINRHTARIACQTCHITRTGGAFAKDFTKWEQALTNSTSLPP